MIVAGDHVLGAEVDERADGWPVDVLHEGGVRAFDGVGE